MCSDATVVRVAGGRATDVIRSLIVLEGMIPIRTVAIIHHTGMLFEMHVRFELLIPKC